MVNGAAPAVFLDRDGVIVVPEFRDRRSYAPRRLEDFRLYPEARASLERLKAAGFIIVVVTNQPDIGKGLIAPATIDAMHRIMMQELPIDAVKTCIHTAAENCDCRKPKPGMLVAAAAELGIDFARSFMVGDRKSDIEAGRAVGCTTIFVDLDYEEPYPDKPDFVVRSIAQATDIILRTNSAMQEAS
jgi:D-glycero-D-manno-heptose 1,7-bisphosphate phosphatase